MTRWSNNVSVDRAARWYTAVLDSRTRVHALPLGVRWMLFLVFWSTLTLAGNFLLAALVLVRPHIAG